MSIMSVPDLAKNGWGLEEEDLNRIIRIEKLEDVSHKFSDQINTITEKFGSFSRLRISDIICEGLLRQKDLVADFLEYFQHDIALREDPASLPQYTSHPNIKRYIRRLALRDNAEWGATIQLAYPKNSNVCKVISQGKKLAVRLNKKYPKASQVHNEIFNLCINTDFHSFKNPEKAASYTKRVIDLLNMKIKTKEKW